MFDGSGCKLESVPLGSGLTGKLPLRFPDKEDPKPMLPDYPAQDPR